jgi:hypothetical protein
MIYFHLFSFFKKGKVLIYLFILGKRPPQFYMPSYEAEIPESQRKDSDIISVKAKSFADREIR